MKRLRLFVVAIAIQASSTFAPADTLWIRSGDTGGGVPRENVKVQKVEKEQIFYLANGNPAQTPLANVVRMRLDDEPALSAAEDAYFAGKFDQAADTYTKALRASNKPWVRDRSAVRLIESANKTGRFDTALVGYVYLVTRDAGLAMQNKPALPEAGSNFLALGIKELDKALGEKNVTNEQKQALLTLKLDLQRVSGDAAGTEATVAELGKTAPSSGDASKGVGNNSQATIQISIAQLAVDQKNYAKARDTIEQNLESFTDPKMQADALFVLAEARYGALGDKYDKPELQDCALAYMRVVAFFQNQAGTPHVPESLYKTGEILERLSEPREALRVFEDLAARYPNSSVGPKATSAVTRLKAPPAQ